jgi:hypothetical protein
MWCRRSIVGGPEVADRHEAVREDVLEEPADARDSVEVDDTLSSATGFAVGDGDGAVLARDDTAIGDGDLEDRGARYLREVWP